MKIRNGGLILGTNSTLQIVGDGASGNASIISVNGSVVLQGQLQVQLNTSMLEFNSNGVAEVEIVSSAANISGSFQNVEFSLQSPDDSSSCNRTIYTTSSKQTVNSFSVFVQAQTVSSCGSKNLLPNWEIAVISVSAAIAVGVIVAVTLVVRKQKSHQQAVKLLRRSRA